MKRKLLVISLLVIALSCIFVISVSAVTGSTSDAFAETAETLDGIPVDLTDTTSRVVLKGADGLYRTFPSAYIYFKTGAGNWNWRGEAKCSFDALNAALELTGENAYTIDSVIRIEFPDDLRYVEGYGGKVNLKEVYFSPNSQMTNMRPFGNKCGLEKITMPPLQTSYPEFLFHTSPNLTTVIFYENENLKSLPKEMFKACTALEEFTFPSSVTSMGDGFFAGCTALRRVTLSPGITSIGTSFSGLANLEYVNTENITSFSNKAFQGCVKLDGIVLNEAVTSIPNDFCKGCSSLTSIVIPAGVTTINGYAFDGCSSLASVTNYAEGIKVLNGNAFSGCPMTEFNMPDKLESIGAYCFNGAQFDEIDIPNAVSSIGQGAFQGCTKLTFLRFPESLTQIPHDSIKGTGASNITIVVSKNTTSIYSQYSLQNTGIQRIIFTGTPESDFVASVQSKASGYVSKIEYANHCEYYYDGAHNYELEGSYDNGCAYYCARCASGAKKENPSHACGLEITYENGFIAHGKRVDTCTNTGCGYTEEFEVEALISFLGLATRDENTGICVGYAINSEAIKAYTDLGNTFNFGVVAYIPTNDAEKELVTNELTPADAQNSIFTELDASYGGFEFVIRGFAQAHYELELAMCAYVYDGNEVDYINVALTNGQKPVLTQDDLAGTISMKKIAEYVPPAPPAAA